MSRIFSRGAGGFGAPGEDPELAMELERIESGCVPHLAEDRCLVILKESAEKEAFLRGAREISAGFFLVEKREFPSVSMDLRIRTEAGLNLRYEHFFLIESPEEISFLEALGRRGAFFLVFPPLRRGERNRRRARRAGDKIAAKRPRERPRRRRLTKGGL